MNILGMGIKDDKRVAIVGDGKSRLSKMDVDDFIRRKLDRVKGCLRVYFPFSSPT